MCCANVSLSLVHVLFICLWLSGNVYGLEPKIQVFLLEIKSTTVKYFIVAIKIFLMIFFNQTNDREYCCPPQMTMTRSSVDSRLVAM